MRAAAAAAIGEDLLRTFYHAGAAEAGEQALIKHMIANASLPPQFHGTGCGEQGPFTWYLLSTARWRQRTRVVPWVQRDAGHHICNARWLYPVRHPSFVHFSGCSGSQQGGVRGPSALASQERCVDAYQLCPRGLSRTPPTIPATSSPNTSTADPEDERVAWQSAYEASLGRRVAGLATRVQLRREMGDWVDERLAVQTLERANPTERNHGRTERTPSSRTLRAPPNSSWYCAQLPPRNYRGHLRSLVGTELRPQEHPTSTSKVCWCTWRWQIAQLKAELREVCNSASHTPFSRTRSCAIAKIANSVPK